MVWGGFWQIKTCFLSQNTHLTPRHNYPEFLVIIYHLSEILSKKKQKVNKKIEKKKIWKKNTSLNQWELVPDMFQVN